MSILDPLTVDLLKLLPTTYLPKSYQFFQPERQRWTRRFSMVTLLIQVLRTKVLKVSRILLQIFNVLVNDILSRNITSWLHSVLHHGTTQNNEKESIACLTVMVAHHEDFKDVLPIFPRKNVIHIKKTQKFGLVVCKRCKMKPIVLSRTWIKNFKSSTAQLLQDNLKNRRLFHLKQKMQKPRREKLKDK